MCHSHELHKKMGFVEGDWCSSPDTGEIVLTRIILGSQVNYIRQNKYQPKEDNEK